MDQLLARQPEPFERKSLDQRRVEESLEGRELGIDLRGDQLVEADAQRGRQTEDLLGLGKFLPGFDLGQVGDRETGPPGEVALGVMPGVAEPGQFDAEHGAEVGGGGHWDPLGAKGLPGR